METVRIRDPGWKKSRIRDKHPGSATLVPTYFPSHSETGIHKENFGSRYGQPKKLRIRPDRDPQQLFKLSESLSHQCKVIILQQLEHGVRHVLKEAQAKPLRCQYNKTDLICSQGIGIFSSSLRMACGMYLSAPR
jgi:hypothetical protein